MSIAIQPIYAELLFARAEAMRIANEQDIRDPEALERIYASVRHRHFMRSIEPWIRAKVRLHNVLLPKIVIYPDEGRVETTYDYTPAQREWLEEIDRFITREAERWGSAPNSSETLRS